MHGGQLNLLQATTRFIFTQLRPSSTGLACSQPKARVCSLGSTALSGTVGRACLYVCQHFHAFGLASVVFLRVRFGANIRTPGLCLAFEVLCLEGVCGVWVV
jgi:hypothetical protein